MDLRNTTVYHVDTTDEGFEEYMGMGHWALRATPNTDGVVEFLQVNYASGSDYSGNLVERVNYKVLLEMMDKLNANEIKMIDIVGGYGSFGILVRADILDKSEDERDEAETELVEALESLDNYPLLDENMLSELEMEAEDEAWDSWVRSDFLREVEKQFGEEERDSLDLLNDNDLRAKFYEAAEAANEYFINEEGDSMWIRVDDVVKKGYSVLSDDEKCSICGDVSH